MKVKNDILKKVAVMPLSGRKTMIDPHDTHLSVSAQCALLKVHRSRSCYKPGGGSSRDLPIMEVTDRMYTEPRKWINRWDLSATCG